MFRKITIGRLGQNAEARTAQNNREFVVLNIATINYFYEYDACSEDAGPARSRTVVATDLKN